MRPTRSSTASFVLTGATFCLLVLALMAVMDYQNARAQPGQTWRRGFLSGDQIRLLDDKRYVLSKWCGVCSDDIVESGTWAGLGEVVSLVPYSGNRPRLMRRIVRDGERYLAASGQSTANPSRESMFVLIQ